MVYSRVRRWRATAAVLLVLSALLLTIAPTLWRHSTRLPLGPLSFIALLIFLVPLYLHSPFVGWLYRVAYDGRPDGWYGFRDGVLVGRGTSAPNMSARDAASRALEHFVHSENRHRLLGGRLSLDVADPIGEILAGIQSRNDALRHLAQLYADAEKDDGAISVLLGVSEYKRHGNRFAQDLGLMGGEEEVLSRSIEFLRSDQAYAWSYAWLDSPFWIRRPLNRAQVAALRFWPFPSLESYSTTLAFQRRFAPTSTRNVVEAGSNAMEQVVDQARRAAIAVLQQQRANEPRVNASESTGGDPDVGKNRESTS